MNKEKNIMIITIIISSIMIISCLDVNKKGKEDKLTNLELCKECWPDQYNSHIKTSLPTRTKFGGGHVGKDSFPEQRANHFPWLKKLFEGCGFAIDYRHRRGHEHMLKDQENSLRSTGKQSGACLHCHSSIVPLYQSLGKGNLDAGFLESCKFSYEEISSKLYSIGHASPLACVDCHDTKTMELKITRPGLIRGLISLAESDSPVPFESIEIWRKGNRKRPYNPNIDASNNEKRSFVCAQCHIEYSCSNKTPLIFPWGKGLKADEIEDFWENTTFNDESEFFDFEHPISGAKMFKVQHPELETWSQGYHAKNEVSCADCHMPIIEGRARQFTDHWIRSPMLNVENSCCQCHDSSEDEMQNIVNDIQEETDRMIFLAAKELLTFIDIIGKCKDLKLEYLKMDEIQVLHRKAQWYLDFVIAENSMGVHSPEETKRLINQSMGFSKKGIQLLSPYNN